MHIPKVKFIDIPLSLEIDWMHGFLFRNEWGWGKYITKKHPEIKQIFAIKTESKQVGFLKKYIIQYKKDNKRLIENNINTYTGKWKVVENDFYITLSDIMQIQWPKNRLTIKAMISINPICPRFLDKWSFSIFFNCKKLSHAMEIIMHESCHFLYFEKWKQLHPRMSSKKFESPHIEWHLSELVAPIILNDKRIQKFIKEKAEFYDEHSSIKIGKKSAPQYFTELYNHSDNFEDFLNKSYQAIKAKKHLFL